MNHQVTKAQRRAIEIRPVQLNKCIDAVVLFVYLSWCLGVFVVNYSVLVSLWLENRRPVRPATRPVDELRSSRSGQETPRRDHAPRDCARDRRDRRDR